MMNKLLVSKNLSFKKTKYKSSRNIVMKTSTTQGEVSTAKSNMLSSLNLIIGTPRMIQRKSSLNKVNHNFLYQFNTTRNTKFELPLKPKVFRNGAESYDSSNEKAFHDVLFGSNQLTPYNSKRQLNKISGLQSMKIMNLEKNIFNKRLWEASKYGDLKTLAEILDSYSFI